MRHTFAVPAVAAVALLAACGTPTATPTVAPATATAVAPDPAATTAPLVTTAPAAAPAAPSTWRMPDLVGSGLQDAQDAIQGLTGFAIPITTSHDATGKGRLQVSDRNWKVCDQSVKPGATITTGTLIDFGAVKLDERC